MEQVQKYITHKHEKNTKHEKAIYNANISTSGRCLKTKRYRYMCNVLLFLWFSGHASIGNITHLCIVFDLLHIHLKPLKIEYNGYV